MRKIKFFVIVLLIILTTGCSNKDTRIKEPKYKVAKDALINIYGDKFDKLSLTQQKFLLSKIESIAHLIKVKLTYPKDAVKNKIEGLNIVEFNLYPNGKISEPKIIVSSKSNILDVNTIRTIKKTYLDYPKPTEKVKVRIDINYKINK